MKIAKTQVERFQNESESRTHEKTAKTHLERSKSGSFTKNYVPDPSKNHQDRENQRKYSDFAREKHQRHI